ncbi:hypothetical protein PVAND_015454 [Polypedilum vanderplanki]|uniref:Hydroxysteroid dehydrogenase-like protein 2 n=1 Tax=Polypedilum vanderplanki TaxID=319348 RepID=A0A9J6BCN7_POLVA|nr:hypothetical protein PVAND_015454 [Polypedilum vanderplanki]
MVVNTGILAGKTVFITGASRGIGKAIALKVAADGANVVIAAKTDKPHPKLPGTIYTAAEEVIAAGGKALPCICDVRFEDQVKAAVKKTIDTFGGIDIVINNASAISLTTVENTDMKRFDLMHQINTRGTFLVTKECLPYLKKSNHAHVVILTPPVIAKGAVLSGKIAYTIAKYGMGLCTLGMSEEFKQYGIAVNGLWPRTIIWTKAVEVTRGSKFFDYSRTPEIMADATYAIISKPPSARTGQIFIDDEILKTEGITDLSKYRCNPKVDEKQLSILTTEENGFVNMVAKL